jgi:lysozyme family protein
MPQLQPQQSYGDFIGEVKSVASNMVNTAASQLGGGLGSALSFIPGIGPIMELIGQVANIGSTVAGATGLGGEKVGTALNLIGSVANGAAGGSNTAGAEEFGPPSPNGFGETSPPTQNTDGGIFSGLRPNQQPSPTAPGTPPFKPQPSPAASDGEGSWFKPLDQMIAEIDERQARGETFDEKTNSWVKGPVPSTTEQPKSILFKQPANARPSSKEEYGPPMPAEKELPPKTVSGKQPTTEADADFDKSFSITLEKEGGFANRTPKEDPGGKTMRGITQSTYDNWIKKNNLQNNSEWPKDVAQLNNSQTKEFYRDEVFYSKKLEEIKNPKIRHVTFDGYTMTSPEGVATYTGQAIKDFLPKADLGKPENVFGSRFREAINSIADAGKTNEFLEKLADRRGDYLKTLKNKDGEFLYKYNPGWLARVDEQRPSNPNNVLQQFDQQNR